MLNAFSLKKGKGKKGAKVNQSQDFALGGKTAGLELTNQGGKKETSMVHGGSKNQKTEVANQLEEMIREQFRDSKDIPVA